MNEMVSAGSGTRDGDAVAHCGPTANRIWGTGEMVERTRALDWGGTALGRIEEWDDVLLSTVNLLLSSRHPMFLWWGEDLIQFYNDGYRPSIRLDKHPKALGQPGRECWPEIWPIIGPQIAGVMERGESSWHEDQLVPIQRDGKLEDVYWTYGYSPVRDVAGEIRGVLVVCTETTGRVAAERQMHLERERLAALFEQAPAFFCVTGGPEHVFEMINPLYAELVGGRSLLGKSVREAIPEVEAQGFVELLDGVYRTGKPFVGRGTPLQLMRSSPAQSELRYLDFVYQPRREDDGTISGVIVLGVDVTETKRAEQALLQSEKLAAVGRLASSIAHEINNPLEAVTNLVYLARRSALAPEVKLYLETAEVELRRVAAIVNRTLRFHRQASFPQQVTCPGLFRATLDLYESRLNNSKVRVEKRYRVDEPVECSEGDVRQVLSNLITNAIDAMPDGGRLLLRSRVATDWRSGRAGVAMTIADTGCGMNAATYARAREAFFTTKGIGGSGLGLWICSEIAQRHEGRMLIRSSQREGRRGTVVSLFLPSKVKGEG